jgi:anionic cell wall polymer biosynthesis LytR-Cps2A-Psr (LCP) family protein
LILVDRLARGDYERIVRQSQCAGQIPPKA